MKLLALLGVFLHWVMFTLLNNRGEGGAGAAGAASGSQGDNKNIFEVIKQFPQADIDKLFQDRVNREREKYSDYDDLKKFKDEHQKQLDAQTQKDLEAKKEYDKAKEAYEKKIADLSGVVTQKDKDISSLRINHALSGELSKANAYVEESMALLAGQVQQNADGTLFIKGKDQNNLDVNLTLEEGVKQFLAKRPHLVKAAARAGSGSTGSGAEGNAGGTASGQAADLMQLNQDYLTAKMSNNHKRAQELKVQIEKALTAKNISRNI